MLPNLIIIGAMKCGTVSLHEYLALHPEISMSPIDELDFFVKERSWNKGLPWYESHFQQPAKIIGERSTGYTKYPMFSGVPERMYSLIPEARLIYSVRDPIQRIISHYMHWYRKRYEHRPFLEVLAESKENHYVQASMYYMQLKQYLPYYSAENILVISSEDLAKKRKETLKRIFQFLGVDPSFEHHEFSQVHHRSSELIRPTDLKMRLVNVPGISRIERIFPHLFERPVERPVLNNSLREGLVEVLSNDVEQLRVFTGCAFVEWSL
jgi:hypothetical protein